MERYYPLIPRRKESLWLESESVKPKRRTAGTDGSLFRSVGLVRETGRAQHGSCRQHMWPSIYSCFRERKANFLMRHPQHIYKLRVCDISFSEDGETLAACTSDGFMHVYRWADVSSAKHSDATSDVVPVMVENTNRKIRKSCFLPNQETLLVGFSSSREIYLYNLISMDSPQRFLDPHETGGTLDFTPRRGLPNQFLVGCRDGTVRLWDSRNASKPSRVFGSKGKGSVVSVTSVSDDNFVMMGYDGGFVQTFDLRHTPTAVKQTYLCEVNLRDKQDNKKPSTFELIEMKVDEERFMFVCKFVDESIGVFNMEATKSFYLQKQSESENVVLDGFDDGGWRSLTSTLCLSPKSGCLFRCVKGKNGLIGQDIVIQNTKQTTHIATQSPLSSLAIHPKTEEFVAGVFHGNRLMHIA